MPINDTEIRVINDSMGYYPKPFGQNAGRPTVMLKLSESDSNARTISALEGVFKSNGWAQKLRSGFARLYIHGNGTLDPENAEPISNFCTIIDPVFVDLEVDLSDTDRIPERVLQNLVDSYTVFVPTDDKYEPEPMEFFAEQSGKFDNVEFIFRFDAPGQEYTIRDISNEYRIYDSNIWLYPRGWTYKSVYEHREYADNIAKRNTWNISPRLDADPANAGGEDED